MSDDNNTTSSNEQTESATETVSVPEPEKKEGTGGEAKASETETTPSSSSSSSSAPEKFVDYVKELHRKIIRFVIDNGSDKDMVEIASFLSRSVTLADAPPVPQRELKSLTEVVQKYNNPIIPGSVREVTTDEIVNTRCVHYRKVIKKAEQPQDPKDKKSKSRKEKKEKKEKEKEKKRSRHKKADKEEKEEEKKEEKKEEEKEKEEDNEHDAEKAAVGDDGDEEEDETSGLTALHLAVRSRNTDLVNLLLTKGGDLTVKSSHGWNSLQEAAADGWLEGLELMLPILQAQEQQQFAQMYPLYCEYLGGLPDFVMEIEWEIKSWLVPLAKYFCPHDKYVIHKRGSSLRIDMNMSELIPALKASGNCSLFFFGEGSPTPGHIMWVSWQNKKKMYLFSRTKHVKIGDVKAAARSYVENPVSRLLKPKDALDPTFADAKSLFGHLKKEKIGDWVAKQVVIKNVALASVTREGTKEAEKDRERIKRSSGTVEEEDDDDYEDKEVTVASFNENGVMGQSRSSRFIPCACCPDELKAKCSSSPIKITTKIKKYEGSAWLSDEFPRQFKDFSPIFRIIGSSQKQVLSLEAFMNTLLKDQPNLFPVKFNVPILPTFSVTVIFKSYKETDKIDPDKFRIPTNIK